MKDLGDYECEGQIELVDIYPITCCGYVPWLHKTQCCRWSENHPQKWMMYYICPKCFKRAVDNTGWTIYAHGTFEEAKIEAVKNWNSPDNKHEVCDIAEKYGFRLQIGLREPEEWENLYGVELQGSYKGFL